MHKNNLNKAYSFVQQYANPLDLFIYLLTLGSTLATGLLSYAGAIALGFSFPAAIITLFLTAIVCLQVNYEMIANAITKLKNFLNNKLINSVFVFVSLLAAISFSISTFYAAIGLFSLGISLGIMAVSTAAFFFITYEILDKTKVLLQDLKLLYKEFNNTLEKRHFLFRFLINATSLIIALSCAVMIVTSLPTWWLETQLGLMLIVSLKLANFIRLLTAPFAIISYSLYSVVNSFEAIFKFRNFNITSNFIKDLKQDAALLFNVPYIAARFIASTTAFTLFLAHSVCHALMGGRNPLAAASATIVDFFADANFTIAPNSKSSVHEHNHSHEPFDGIVMVSQLALTLPLQILAVPFNIILSKLNNTDLSLKQCVIKSFKQSFYFVKDYIDSKKHEHSCGHHHNHDHESHSHDNHNQNQQPKDKPSLQEPLKRQPPVRFSGQQQINNIPDLSTSGNTLISRENNGFSPY